MNGTKLEKLRKQLSGQLAAVNALSRSVETLNQHLLATDQRALSAKEIDQAVWKIWGYVRLNKDSLDSEIHNNGVRAIIEKVVADMQRRLDVMAADLHAARKANAEQKRHIKELQLEVIAAHSSSPDEAQPEPPQPQPAH